MAKKVVNKSPEFSIVDNTVVGLIVEKTKLNKEKYGLILSKTVIVYIIIIAMSIYSTVAEIISKQIMLSLLIIGTVLLFIVYFYVIDHFDKIDKDIDEVITLLQTKHMIKRY
jgi:hypothetical protein